MKGNIRKVEYSVEQVKGISTISIAERQQIMQAVLELSQRIKLLELHIEGKMGKDDQV